jgi:hypothetical protein
MICQDKKFSIILVLDVLSPKLRVLTRIAFVDRALTLWHNRTSMGVFIQ